MSKIIAVSSFKGGTAKTSTALHVGAALALFHKKKVLLIDFEPKPNVTTGLGYDPDRQDSLAPVLQGKKKIQDVIVKTGVKNLHLLPADTWLERIEVTGVLAADRYSHERLKALLKTLSYEIILIDTPPSLCWLTESALIAAEHSLICATPEFYSVKGLQRLSHFMKNIAERHPFSIVGVALSFWNERGKSNQAFLEVIEETFPERLFQSKIRRDIRISEASVFGKPVFKTAPKSRAAHDYLSLTKEVLARIYTQVDSRIGFGPRPSPGVVLS